MNYPPATISRATINNKTRLQDRRLQNAVKAAFAANVDGFQRARYKACECKVCFYLNKVRIGGAAMTEQPCGICGTIMTFGNTCTNAVCLDCAKTHNLCKHCGCDLHLRASRRKDEWPGVPLPAPLIQEKLDGSRIPTTMFPIAILLPQRKP